MEVVDDVVTMSCSHFLRSDGKSVERSPDTLRRLPIRHTDAGSIVVGPIDSAEEFMSRGVELRDQGPSGGESCRTDRLQVAKVRLELCEAPGEFLVVLAIHVVAPTEEFQNTKPWLEPR